MNTLHQNVVSDAEMNRTVLKIDPGAESMWRRYRIGCRPLRVAERALSVSLVVLTNAFMHMK